MYKSFTKSRKSDKASGMLELQIYFKISVVLNVTVKSDIACGAGNAENKSWCHFENMHIGCRFKNSA